MKVLVLALSISSATSCIAMQPSTQTLLIRGLLLKQIDLAAQTLQAIQPQSIDSQSTIDAVTSKKSYLLQTLAAQVPQAFTKESAFPLMEELYSGAPTSALLTACQIKGAIDTYLVALRTLTALQSLPLEDEDTTHIIAIRSHLLPFVLQSIPAVINNPAHIAHNFIDEVTALEQQYALNEKTQNR